MQNLIDEDVEKNAKKLHEDYQRNFCTDRIGACANWDELSEIIRQSNRSAAIHAFMKQKVLQSREINPETDELDDQVADLLAEMEHNRWMAERMLAGWRYAPEKDDANLLRPAIQPWSSISEAERDKNRSQVKQVVRRIKRQSEIRNQLAMFQP